MNEQRRIALRSMQHYKQIIIGGTFYGCGLAATTPGSIVFEAANQVGSDAVFTFNPGSDWEQAPAHPLAQAFKERLATLHVLRENRLQVGGLAPVFAEWCLARNLDVRFLSQVVGQDDTSVTVISPAGKETFSGDRVVDARPRRKERKKITALVKHDEQQVSPQQYEHFEIGPGPFADESYLLMEIPETTGWTEARKQLHQAWRQRPKSLEEWQLVLIGPHFDFCQFPNPVAALDAGLREAFP